MSAGLFEHYGVDGVEDTRLRRSPHGRPEFVRTQDLLRRHLPPGRQRIVDVGGAQAK